MMLWWTSWWTRDDDTNPPFKAWITGERGWRFDDSVKFSLCASIAAQSEAEATSIVMSAYPDAEMRFCHEQEGELSDRFQ